GAITDTYTKFIHPGRTIPLFIQDLTNITDEDVKDAKAFEFYAETVFEKMQDAIFVAHNTNFDLPFLQAELKRSGLPKWHGITMDTVELVRLMYPTAFSYKLQDITSELGIPLESAHRADDDAMATALLFLRAKNDLESLPYDTLTFIHKRSIQLKSDLSRLFFELTQKKRNAQADEFDRFQGIPLKPRKTFSADPEQQNSPPRDWREGLETVLPKFEKRPSQYGMMASIEDALLHKKELVIEASTGMGKTIAYLLPAVNYALDTGKQVMISTYTTHLQDQLVLKEGQMVEKFIGSPVRISLIKGLSHYIDLGRFVELLHGDDESY